MRRLPAQFLQSAIAGQPRGVAHQPAQSRVIGMLVFNDAGRQHDGRADAPDDFCQLDGVGGAHFQMRVAIEFKKFKSGAEQRGGFFGLGDALFGRAVTAGFAARADDKMCRAAGARFLRDDAATAEFDVVRMRAKSEQRRAVQGSSV